MLNLLESNSFQVVVIHTFIIHVMLQVLEKTINMFVKTELQIFQRILSPDYTEDSEGHDMLDSEEGEQGKSSRETLLNITLHFLRRMKKDELADSLQSSKRLNIM